MSGNIPESRLRRVNVLNEMVPDIPLPNDFAARLAGRLDLDQAIDEYVAGSRQLGLQTGGKEFGGCFSLPDVHQNIAVGQASNRVMANLLLVVKLIIPDQF